MTRLRLTWLVNTVNENSRARRTFIFFVLLEALHLTISFHLGFDVGPSGRIRTVFDKTLASVALILVGFKVCSIALTRRRVRRRYGIPDGDCCLGGCCDCCPSLCGGLCEDCCRATFCGCCAVAQMGRHTADYDTYRGIYCSSTGLPPRAPIV